MMNEFKLNNHSYSNPYFVDDDFILVGVQIFINIATM